MGNLLTKLKIKLSLLQVNGDNNYYCFGDVFLCC